MKYALTIFLVTLGIYIATINSWNAKYFGLQAATVAALADRGTFALVDQIIPGFNLVEGDETFRYDKNVYPMKQPGQTVLGAIIYKPLQLLNWTMYNHYDYVIHIITIFTSSIMMAMVSVLIYIIAYQVSKEEKRSIITAVTYTFGTIVWPYAGVIHHDIYATFFVFGSVALFYRYNYINKKETSILGSGIMAGLALFFSMLPVSFPFVMLVVVASSKKIKAAAMYSIGVLAGLIPSFIFNYTQFGNIFLFPNIAGKVADTVPTASLSNLYEHLYFYLLSPKYSFWTYSPVLIFGIWGVFKIPRKYHELKKVMLAVPLIQLLHISLQETFGGFQYGPRYLLTVIPLLSLGIVFGMQYMKNKYLVRLFYLSLAYSISTAAIGAVQTVMYPVPGTYGPTTLLSQIMGHELPIFRMLPLGLTILAIACWQGWHRYHRG